MRSQSHPIQLEKVLVQWFFPLEVELTFVWHSYKLVVRPIH